MLHLNQEQAWNNMLRENVSINNINNIDNINIIAKVAPLSIEQAAAIIKKVMIL